ncbi:MFS transporter [Escherichia coli]|uniref:MFS transporter n=10 Tax=Gammaproteobacteria TaxID=1236 RepID=UPI00098A2E23
MKRHRNVNLLLMLVLLVAVGQMAQTIYIPAIADMARDLNVREGAVQSVMGAYLLTYGVSQLFYGPISDRVGRRPVILVGMSIFMLATLVAVTTSSLTVLIAASAMQGMGTGVGGVMARTLPRDLYERTQLRHANSLLNMGILVSPLLAPLIGGLLDTMWNWRACYLFLLVLCAGVTFSMARWMPETRPVDAPRTRLLTSYKTLFGNSGFNCYLLMLIGGLVGFSMIGIEWSKLQWLVAALGVGLGFGLQEIFANFISGLIILFEKPIRIGDTVTIRDLTGSVTKINTRATTISDWDRKEIIVPNKAFITEQFINWSLSDSVTRVVLTIPAPADANSEEVTEILLTAARRCSLVIDNPAPEVFLVDLQQGIQIFELRIYAAEMGHRMPLRHEIHQLILAGFHAHGIDMPFPPFQMRLESLNGKQTGRTLTSAGKGRQAGSL